MTTHDHPLRHTPAPQAIVHAWQIMAATAHILDPPFRPSMRDLFGMITITEAMDTLVDVNPRYPPIDPGDHAPHTPTQAATCALAHLNTHRPATAEEATRIRRVQRLLTELLELDHPGRRPPGPADPAGRE